MARRRRRESLADIARKLGEDVPLAAVERVNDAFQAAARRETSRELGGGGAPFGADMRTRARTRRRKGSVTMFVAGTPAGIWVWLEDGIRPHRIPTPMSGAVPLGNGEFRSMHGDEIDHPGVRKWSGAWTRTVEDVDADMVGILDSAFVEVERRI